MRRADRRAGDAGRSPERDRARSERSSATSCSSAAVTITAPPSACRQRFAISASSDGRRGAQRRTRRANTDQPGAQREAASRRRDQRAAGTAASASTRLNAVSTHATSETCGVELAQDVRQAEGDHRGVGQHEADGRGQRRGPHFSRRDRRRSFRTRPPVWQAGQ